MIRRSTILLTLGSCATFFLTGCMPKMTMAEMKEHMPKRPAELDQLNAFVGHWEFEGEANMAMLDEPMKTSGTSDTKWDDSKWFVTTRSSFNMGDFDPMSGFETYAYDCRAKKFRSSWVDSMGSIGTGTFWLDDKSGTWQMRAKSRSPFGSSTMKGHIKFVDDNTMEFCVTEYMGLTKTMEMSGTSHRK